MLLRLLSSGSFFNQCFYPDAEGAAGGSVDPAPTANPEDGGEQEPALTIDELKALNKKYAQEAASRRVALKAEKEEKQKLMERLQKFEKFAKGEESTDEKPDLAAELQSYKQRLEEKEIEETFAKMALQNGLNLEQHEYFTIFMTKAVNNLEEDEELSEEAIQACVDKAKAIGGTTVKKDFKTSVTSNGAGAGTPPPATSQSTVTVQQFAKMSITEKGQLYSKDQSQYTNLMKEARELNLI